MAILFDRAGFLRSVGHIDFTLNPWRSFGPTVNEAALEAERRVHNRRRTLAQPLLPGVEAPPPPAPGPRQKRLEAPHHGRR
jgi:hypothetical protein